jgi:hypothetical protein
MASESGRAAAALAALEATPGRGRMRAADRRLLRAGLAALEGRPVEALREARAVIGEYGRLGLPWRQALATLMLLSTIGPDDAEVRREAESAREILARLGARPFLERLDAALARPAAGSRRPADQVAGREERVRSGS